MRVTKFLLLLFELSYGSAQYPDTGYSPFRNNKLRFLLMISRGSNLCATFLPAFVSSSVRTDYNFRRGLGFLLEDGPLINRIRSLSQFLFQNHPT